MKMKTIIENNEPKKNKIIICDNCKALIGLIRNPNDNSPIFLTGKAGTGKSTLINYLKELPEKLKCISLAPTGIAAINVKGITIHKFFGIPTIDLSKLSVVNIAEKFYGSQGFKALIKSDILIIDEVSMVRADMLDTIDLCMRKSLSKDLPFGGKKVILVGDPYQLPPIVKDEEAKYLASRGYDSELFFSSNVIKNSKPYLIELEKIYRQDDLYFINTLNKIRNGTISDFELKLLNDKILTQNFEVNNEFSIIVSTTNKIADNYNFEKLQNTKGYSFTYEAITEGEFPESMRPVPESLQLKEDTQIMFVNNDKEGRWQNGTIGKVIDLDDDFVTVQKEDGTIVNVAVFVFENLSVVNGNVTAIGEYIQFPLKLAWAVTIHKCQGLTFNNVKVDLGSSAFVNGQTYVALSRCRKIEGLQLNSRIKMSDIKVHPKLKDYQKRFTVLKSRIEDDSKT